MGSTDVIPHFEARAVNACHQRLASSEGNVMLHPRPKVSRHLLGLFAVYARRYIRRHFHSLRYVHTMAPPQMRGRPLVVFSNHSSWWDALLFIVLKQEFFPDYTAFAPIDAAALNRYRFFSKLGFFPVEQNRRRGAVQFLNSAAKVLRTPNALLALTPQARFADVRERPVRFKPGLGHLPLLAPEAVFLPLAIEYVFWEERLPEILIGFGEAIDAHSSFPPTERANAADWTLNFESALQTAQDHLSAEAKARNPEHFRRLLVGGAGQGGIYDFWRWAKAAFTAQPFRAEHGLK